MLLLLGLLAGCSKHELMRYNSDNDIYFGNTTNTTGSSTDIFQVNFASFPTKRKDTIATIIVRLMGQLSDKNRSFNLSVDESKTTAIAGKHYVMVPQDSFYIPAFTQRQRLVFKILRPDDLYEKSFSLFLKLSPNENFSTGMKVFDYAATTTVLATSMEIKIEDLILKPEIWDNNSRILGTFSRKKMLLFIEIRKLDLARFYSGIIYSTAQLATPARLFQIYLNAQKNAGQTIYDEDGSEMKMGPAAQ